MRSLQCLAVAALLGLSSHAAPGQTVPPIDRRLPSPSIASHAAPSQTVPPIDPTRGVIFSSDFESGIPTGWTVSGNKTTSLTPTTRFLGNFSSAEFVQFTLKNLTPGLSYTIMFDFVMLDSWDGSNTIYGPDYFTVTADGTFLLRETFVNPGLDFDCTWSGDPDQTGAWNGGSWSDSIFRKVAVNFTARTATATVKFIAENLQGLSDESWGVDNLFVMETSWAGSYAPAFTDVSRTLNFRGKNTTSIDNGCGLLWADINADGVPDCLMTGSAARLYSFNRSSGKYTVSNIGTFQRQATFADFDNDGDIDIFGFSSATGEQLMMNSGAGVFTNGLDGGFSKPTTNEGLASVDANKDGLVDLVAMGGGGNWLGTNAWVPASTSVSSRENSAKSNGNGNGNANGNKKATGITAMFTQDSEAPSWLNPVGSSGDGHFMSAADINADGVSDLFYHFGTGVLWLSQTDGRFARSTLSRFGTFSERGKVGSSWGDFDNDGDFDLFVPSWATGVAGNLWRNDGDRFVNVSASAGLTNGWGHRSCCWGDYDNDGDLDLYIVCRGMVGNVLYKNNGSGGFSIVDERCRVSGMECGDAVFVDTDNDGDLDLAVSGINTNNRLFRNGVTGNNYLKVRFVGMGEGATNEAGIGMSVTLFDSGRRCLGVRQIGTARGFGGIEPLWVHFGGVDPGARYTVRITSRGRSVEVPVVPGAVSTTIGPTTIRQMLTIDESNLPQGMKIIRWREVTSVE